MNYFSANPSSDFARVKVLVAHALPVVSAGLAATLAKEAMFEVIAGTASDGKQDMTLHERCDVIVTDRQGATEWIVRLRSHARTSHQTPPRILIVDDSNGEAQVRAALCAGVHGYMLTDCGLRELVEGIGLLSKGRRYLCSTVASRMAESLTRTSLTPRETDVLTLMVKGHSNKIIAHKLDIAVGTVKAHAKAVFEKLGVRTRNEAVALSNQRGLVHEPAFN